jgi:hypothetical protein
MSEWISVEDGLPKNDDEYLIWPHHKYAGAIASFYPWDDNNGHVKNTFEIVSDYDEVSQVSVTHWMPLPKPPTQ